MKIVTQIDTSEKVKSWLQLYQETYRLNVEQINFTDSTEWSFTENNSALMHKTGGFFSIKGLRFRSNFYKDQVFDQPIIHQPEIGILGFLAKMHHGELFIFAHAKIEPGNVNIVQIGPTLQATESNYKGLHGGNIPTYLDYFIATESCTVLVDQLQSEQGTRFYKKRNRNMVVMLPENHSMEDTIHHKWIPFRLWKELLGLNYIVNTDTRSVLASLIFGHFELVKSTFCSSEFSKEAQKSFLASDEDSYQSSSTLFAWLEQLKQHYYLETSLIPLSALTNWTIKEHEISSESGNYFTIEQFRISCLSREVPLWDQPLVNTFEEGFLGLICKNINGVFHILLQAKLEPGNYDKIEFTSTIHQSLSEYEELDGYYFAILNDSSATLIAEGNESEEGGRFFKDKNSYKIVYLNERYEVELKSTYQWVTLNQVSTLIRLNNFLTNELRSLLALMSSKF